MSSQQPQQGGYTAAQAAAYYAQNPQAYQYYQVSQTIRQRLGPDFVFVANAADGLSRGHWQRLIPPHASRCIPHVHTHPDSNTTSSTTPSSSSTNNNNNSSSAGAVEAGAVGVMRTATTMANSRAAAAATRPTTMPRYDESRGTRAISIPVAAAPHSSSTTDPPCWRSKPS